MPKILVPKREMDITPPVIYLAGPIKGAPPWHREAMLFLFSKQPNLTIITPQHEIGPDLLGYVIQSENGPYPRQRNWEIPYMRKTSRNGAVLFWLPGEVNHKCEKPYGSMTRVELGEALGEYSLGRTYRFCIGTDGKFYDIGAIREDVLDRAPDKMIYDTLEKTCLEALRLANP